MADGEMSGAGVLVLGMHRAGTSACARAINLLGIPLAPEQELQPASPNNPTGFWEVERLTAFNERLLSRLGGTSLAPPQLSSGWSRNPRLERRRLRARRVFEQAHRTDRWVWKDPRNCVLLPFWREVLDGRTVVVLVHREPDDIARSLVARSPRQRLSRALSYAAWERHLREALRNARGLPAYVTRYEDLIASPTAWARDVGAFLRDQGLKTDPEGGGAPIAEFVESRRSPGNAPEDADDARNETPAARNGSSASRLAQSLDDGIELSARQRELAGTVESLVGPHDRLGALDLPPETAWVEPLLAERRRAEVLRRQAEESLRSTRRRLRAVRARRRR